MHHNSGFIMVPCRLCGRDIDRADYVALEGAHLEHEGTFMLLFHKDCATLLSEGIDQALNRGPVEANRGGYFTVAVYSELMPWLTREAQERGCLAADVVDDAANEELQRRREAVNG
jgi:hypothetical protein